MSEMSFDDQEVDQSEPRRSGKGKGMMGWLVGIIVLIVVIGGVLFAYNQYGSEMMAKAKGQDYSGWQAVFLTNGQVYFGKIKSQDDNNIILRDIYYLQVVTKPLQRTQEAATTDAANQEQQLTLIKLGNELHGPTDNMVINRAQVLLTEKLRLDSKVVQAINSYLKQQKASSTAATK